MSRFYMQALVAVGLVAVVGAVSVLPAGRAAEARTAFAWVVREDFDFAAAARWVGQTGRARLEGWLSTLHVPGLSGGTPTSTARPAMPTEGAVLTEYGWSKGKPARFHEGIDLAAQQGTPVVAALDGKVIRVASTPELGQVVEIDHGRVSTVYAGVTEVSVKVGADVLRGQRIALVAAPTGAERAMPPHLHFEVRAQRGGYSMDPASFLGLGGSKI